MNGSFTVSGLAQRITRRIAGNGAIYRPVGDPVIDTPASKVADRSACVAMNRFYLFNRQR